MTSIMNEKEDIALRVMRTLIFTECASSMFLVTQRVSAFVVVYESDVAATSRPLILLIPTRNIVIDLLIHHIIDHLVVSLWNSFLVGKVVDL